MCEICGREFSRKAHYNEHMRGHRGDYPYNCTKCKKGFFRPKLFKEHRCTEGSEQVAHARVFRPRRVKRKPGRPRKIVRKTSSCTAGAREINVVNPGNQKENQVVIDNVVRSNQTTISKRKDIAIERTGQQVKTENSHMESDENESSTNTTEEADVGDTESSKVITSNTESVVFINTISEPSKLKVSKPECYVKTPAPNLPASLPVAETYITVQLATTNNCDGGEIQAQLITAGDFGGQLQFPAQLELSPSGALHPIQIIESHPLALAVSQADQLGDVSVEQNVIDIPVDIVTVSNDQALVCSQEDSGSGEGEGTAQVYEIEDYGAGDTVLQGSENLIDSSVEIMGPENM